MVNSNPETVSTDYDTSDKLFFEPLTLEDVLNICHHEKPDGVIVQFGGQTPLNLAAGLKANGVPIIGTSVESIERAEDRKLFQQMLNKLGLNQPPNGTATNEDEAVAAAAKVGYPVLVRPQLRPRRTRHADRLQRRRTPLLHAQRRRRLARAPRPGRPLPRRRHRSRCRLHRRRRDRRDRRDHGAHRAGRRPFRRLAPASFPRRRFPKR